MTRIELSVPALEAFERGMRYLREREDSAAIDAFSAALILEPDWPPPWVQLATAFARRKEWAGALGAALHAVDLDPSAADAHIFRLVGLSATAIGEWDRARWAWQQAGLSLREGEGPIEEDLGPAVVRVARSGVIAELWCHRLDPVRGRLSGVPPPATARRHADVVLHGPAPVGHRRREGVAYPLFEELALLEPSSFRTWIADIVAPSRADFDELLVRCTGQEIHVDDWSASPDDGAHRRPWNADRRLGVAACDPRRVEILFQWALARPHRKMSAPHEVRVAKENES